MWIKDIGICCFSSLSDGQQLLSMCEEHRIFLHRAYTLCVLCRRWDRGFPIPVNVYQHPTHANCQRQHNPYVKTLDKPQIRPGLWLVKPRARGEYL